MTDKTALEASINGNLDSFIVRETIKGLNKSGKDTFTIAELRLARHKVLGVKND